MFYLNVEDFDLDEELIIDFFPSDSIEESYLEYSFTDSPPQNLIMNLTYYSTQMVTDKDEDNDEYNSCKFNKKENKKFMVVRFTAIKDEVIIAHLNMKFRYIFLFCILGFFGLLILIGIIYWIYYCCKKRD